MRSGLHVRWAMAALLLGILAGCGVNGDPRPPHGAAPAVQPLADEIFDKRLDG